MATLTLNTIFDTAENLTFVALDKNNQNYAVLLINNGEISLIYSDGRTKKFENESVFQKFVNDNSLYFLRPTRGDERWIMYQPNPKGLNTGDCTIRAYTKAFGMSWEDAYEMASGYGKIVGALPDDHRVVDKILKEYKYTCTRVKKSDYRMTVSEFAATHPTGTYLLKIHGHLVACVDGFYYDSWNSGPKKVAAIYTK